MLQSLHQTNFRDTYIFFKITYNLKNNKGQLVRNEKAISEEYRWGYLPVQWYIIEEMMEQGMTAEECGRNSEQ